MEQLPNVFELLSQALRAGNSLASAMQLIATELPIPRTEFGRVFHEQNLGLKIEDALRNLGRANRRARRAVFRDGGPDPAADRGDLAEVLDKITP